MPPMTPAASTDRQLHAALDTLEDRFELLERQVVSLQRLAALGTASATLAHEFNNMLTPVLSYCQFAMERNDTALMKMAIEKTIKNIGRLNGVCSRIMNMAAGHDGEQHSARILDVVRDAVECLGRDLKKDDITINVDVSNELIAIVDPAALHQVLFNLLLNARQAMLNRGGQLVVRAGQFGGNIQIEVSDTGCGIPGEHLDRIFEPFFTTKKDQQGAGLGLHVCRQLMQEMNGEITVTRRSPVGTTFKLTLPIGKVLPSEAVV